MRREERSQRSPVHLLMVPGAAGLSRTVASAFVCAVRLSKD